MSEVVAGAASGFLMGMVFVGVGAMMLFALVSDPPRILRYLLDQAHVVNLAVPLAFLSMAIWGVIGLIMGLLYRQSLQEAPGSGIGTQNLVYTLGVVVVAAVMAPPIFILMRRVLKGLLVMLLGFVGIFGWFLPFFSG